MQVCAHRRRVHLRVLLLLLMSPSQRSLRLRAHAYLRHRLMAVELAVWTAALLSQLPY